MPRINIKSNELAIFNLRQQEFSHLYGSIVDRDYNAAKNIRDEGIRLVFA